MQLKHANKVSILRKPKHYKPTTHYKRRYTNRNYSTSCTNKNVSDEIKLLNTQKYIKKTHL